MATEVKAEVQRQIGNNFGIGLFLLLVYALIYGKSSVGQARNGWWWLEGLLGLVAVIIAGLIATRKKSIKTRVKASLYGVIGLAIAWGIGTISFHYNVFLALAGVAMAYSLALSIYFIVGRTNKKIDSLIIKIGEGEQNLGWVVLFLGVIVTMLDIKTALDNNHAESWLKTTIFAILVSVSVVVVLVKRLDRNA